MNLFDSKRLRLKIVFVAVAIILLVALPLLTRYVSIGKIPLGPTQTLYAVLSCEIVVAVYIWGVGNWSRFEPPLATSSRSASQNANPPEGKPAAGTGASQNATGSPQKDGH